MVAALKPEHLDRRFPPRQPVTPGQGSNVTPFPSNPKGRSRSHPLPSQSVSSRANASPTIRTLPNQQSIPLWLKLLALAQRSSTVLTLLLAVGVLATYGWTVYTQRFWSEQYRQLETLQRYERQLTTANEVLKNQMALQAESPASGLTLPSANNTIFLQPAPQRPEVDPPAEPPIEPQPPTPVGY